MPSSGKTNQIDGDGRKPAVDRLAERVFLTCPRVLSFSHRKLTSLRHPYLRVAYESIEQRKIPAKARLDAILEVILEAKKETERWTRVGGMFDSKLGTLEMDKQRQLILFSRPVMEVLESFWNVLTPYGAEMLTDDVYKQFYTWLCSFLLNVKEVSITPAMLSVISEDFMYDARGLPGISFGSFAVSMMELADNWTDSRSPDDMVDFLQRVMNAYAPQAAANSAPAQVVEFPPAPWYAGGILAKRRGEKGLVYYKTTSSAQEKT